MKYKFYYFFLLFFEKFNYLPASLVLKPFHYTKDNFWQYLLGSFFKKGMKLKFLLMLYNNFGGIWNRFCMWRLPFLSYFNYMQMTVFLFKFNFFNFFFKFKFLFFYYYQQLNKKIYKFSRYKASRYNFRLQYLPTYRRFRKLITFFSKSLLYESKGSFTKQLRVLIFRFFINKQELFFYKFVYYLQRFIFIKHRKTLFNQSRLKK